MGSLRDKIKFDGAEAFETTKGTWNYLFGGYQYFLSDYNDRNQEFILCCINSCGASVRVLLSGTVVSLTSHRSNCQKPTDSEIQRRRFQTQAKELVRLTKLDANDILWHVKERMGPFNELSNNEALRLIIEWIRQFRGNNQIPDFVVNFCPPPMPHWPQPFLSHPCPPMPYWPPPPFSNYPVQSTSNFGIQPPIHPPPNFGMPPSMPPSMHPPNLTPNFEENTQSSVQSLVQLFKLDEPPGEPSKLKSKLPVQPPKLRKKSRFEPLNLDAQSSIEQSKLKTDLPMDPPKLQPQVSMQSLNFEEQPLNQLPKLQPQILTELPKLQPQVPTELPKLQPQIPIKSSNLESQPTEPPKLQPQILTELPKLNPQISMNLPKLNPQVPIEPSKLHVSTEPSKLHVSTEPSKLHVSTESSNFKTKASNQPLEFEKQFPTKPPDLETQSSIQSLKLQMESSAQFPKTQSSNKPSSFNVQQENSTDQSTKDSFNFQTYIQKQLNEQVAQQNSDSINQHCIQLKQLIIKTQAILCDPKAKDKHFDRYSSQFFKTIKQATNVSKKLQTTSLLFHQLNDLIEKANETQKMASEKAVAWKKFKKTSAGIPKKVNELKNLYDELKNIKPIKKLSDDCINKMKNTKQMEKRLCSKLKHLDNLTPCLEPISFVKDKIFELKMNYDEVRENLKILRIEAQNEHYKIWLQTENNALMSKLHELHKNLDKMNDAELEQLEKEAIPNFNQKFDALLAKEKILSPPHKFVDKSAQQLIESLKFKIKNKINEPKMVQWLEYKKPLNHQLLEISNQATNLINIYDDESIRNCQLKDFLEKLDKFGSNVHKVNHQLDLASKKLFDFELPDDIKSQFIEELDRDKETLDSNVEKIMDLKKRMEVNNPLIQQFLAHQFNLLSETFNNMCNEINNAQQIENLQQRFRKIYTLKLQAYLLLNDINDFYKSNETQLNSNYSTIDLYGFKLKVKELENFIGFALENTSNQMELNESLVNNQMESNDCLSNNQVGSNESIMDKSLDNGSIMNEPTFNEPIVDEPIIIDLIDNESIMDKSIIIDQIQASSNLLDKLETKEFKEHYKSLDLEERKALDIEIFNQKRIKREQDKKTRKLSDLRINNGGIQIEECSRCGKLKHKYLKELCRSCYCKVNKKK